MRLQAALNSCCIDCQAQRKPKSPGDHAMPSTCVPAVKSVPESTQPSGLAVWSTVAKDLCNSCQSHDLFEGSIDFDTSVFPYDLPIATLQTLLVQTVAQYPSQLMVNSIRAVQQCIHCRTTVHATRGLNCCPMRIYVKQ